MHSSQFFHFNALPPAEDPYKDLTKTGWPEGTLVTALSCQEKTTEAFTLEKHRHLFAYWLEKRGTAQFPDVCELDPIKFPKALGHVNVVEPDEKGEAFTYRVYGSQIGAITNRDMTGKTNRDFPGPVARMSQDIFQAVLKHKQPLYCENDAPIEVSSVVRWSRLILPFGNGQGEIARIITCTIDRPRRLDEVCPNIFDQLTDS